MRLATLLVLAIRLSIATIAPAQEAPATGAASEAPPGPMLTDAAVQRAIDQGMKGQQQPGVTVKDLDSSDYAGAGCHHCGETEFDVTLYTASQWIEAQAAAAKMAKKPFTLADVTKAMRAPVVYLIAEETFNDLDLTATAVDIGFRQIELTDAPQRRRVEPLLHKFSQQRGAPGAGLTGHVVRATGTAVFSVSSVKSVMDGGEFYVCLTTPSRPKFLKVKTSALSKAM